MDYTNEALSRTVTFILAGGRGERLLPLTRDRAKPAVPFGDGRIIDSTFRNVVASSLGSPIVITGHCSASLIRHARHWWRRERDLEAPPVMVPAPSTPYSGTADALYRNLDRIPDPARYALVLSSDHIYEMDYTRLVSFHLSRSAELTVASIVHPLEGANRFGVIGTDGDAHILEFAEKPRNPRPLPDAPSSALVNMGVYLFDVDVLRAALEWDHRDAESSHDLGRDVLPRLVDQSRAFAFRFEEKDGEPGYWQDVGTVDSYYEASMAWLRHRRPATTGYVRNSVVAGNVRIHPTARVQDSILLSGVSVGAGARVSRAILNEKVQVQDGARVDAARSPDRYLTRTPAGVLVAASGAVIARSR